jgi:hypothetical protein
MTTAELQDWPDWRRLQRAALGVGVVGALLCVLAAFLDPQQFFFAYLIGFLFWTGIALGGVAIWMLHNLTGGAWGALIRRMLEAGSRTLPLLAILFVPVAVGMPFLYLWVNPQEATQHQAGLLKQNAIPVDALPEFQRHLLEQRKLPEREERLLAHKKPFLNRPFFLIRTALYFLVWITLAAFLGRQSARLDQEGTSDVARTLRGISGPGLAIYALTVTLAAVDWIMSLEPMWWSTIFGALVATGQLLPALAFAILLAAWLSPVRPLADLTSPTAWNDLGNLLLAFVMLWSYMMFSQLLLIYSGNLAEEIPWYTIRSVGGWQWLGALLALFYFLLPFLMLLSRDFKRQPARLMIVASLILAMSFLHQVWMVGPVFSPGRFYLSWMAIVAVAGIGGLWLGVFLRQLQARPLVPLHDPSVQDALYHREELHHA